MEYKDYYKLLGLSRSASQDEIKKAYRKLAHKYHPDISREADAEARFKEVNEAYEVLKDPEKRAAYDQLGAGWKAGQDYRPPPDWEKAFGDGDAHFSDFFESLFGGGRFGQQGNWHHAGFGMPGEDQHASIEIDAKDAFHGGTRTFRVQLPEIDGRGGVRRRERTLKVRIPPGVTNGQKIRLAGQGAPGLGGGPNGDLFLEVHLKEHPLFRLERKDVYLDLPLTPWEAALGTTIAVPTLAGNVELKTPAGSQSGQKLRLRGRGLPGRPPGNQYVVLQIMTPAADSEAATALYRRMAEEMPFDPRGNMAV